MRVKCVDLYLGDSLKIMSEFKDNSIDLIITDPPYLLGAGGGGGGATANDSVPARGGAWGTTYTGTGGAIGTSETSYLTPDATSRSYGCGDGGAGGLRSTAGRTGGAGGVPGGGGGGAGNGVSYGGVGGVGARGEVRIFSW